MSTNYEQMQAEVLVSGYHGSDWQAYSYLVPGDLAGKLKAGSIVTVPFGKRSCLGLVQSTGQLNNKTSKYQIKSITRLVLNTTYPTKLVELAQWVQRYYVAPLEQVLKPMLPTGITTKRRQPQALEPIKLAKLPKLTTQQQAVFDSISHSDKNAHKYLLHGITGSGKTVIYLHLLQQAIKSGKSALLLVPEIVLAESMVKSIQRYFPQAVILHSGLSVATRLARWQAILEGSSTTPTIVVGTRSALFAPIAKLGLIVIDEAHEPSYKQDSGIRYQTVDVAAQLCNLHHANLVLGSATPSLVQYQLAKTGKLELLTLSNRHQDTALPNITYVQAPKGEILSPELQTAITDTVAANNQVLLLHNRRGSARSAVCTSCGQASSCPDCEVAMVYHADHGKLVCHYCGKQLPPPAICNSCGSHDIRFVGFGTKAVEAELNQQFPKSRVTRLDADIHKLTDIGKILSDMNAGYTDILVGTQMISRGLDFDRVSLVGVISAESALSIPDFSASERAFDMMVQAAGRAGRRNTQGQVIIQTYNPQQPVLQAVAEHDYEQFARHELELRQQYLYPPFTYLVQLTCGFAERERGRRELEALKAKWRNQSGLSLVGPVPTHPFARGRKYYWQLVAKSARRSQLTKLCETLPATIIHNLDPINLL